MHPNHASRDLRLRHPGLVLRPCTADACIRLLSNLGRLLGGLLTWLLLVPLCSQAAWLDGSFTNDTPGSPPPAPWTLSTYLNQTGATITTPMTEAALNLSPPGSTGSPPAGTTQVVAGPIQDPQAPALGALPWAGQAVVLNLGGTNHSVNKLSQVATMGSADVDPTDGLVHVRLAVAPVLENTVSHTLAQQPYVFVALTNLTRSTQFLGYFAAANQAGIPWMTVNLSGNRQYVSTSWQTFDIAPGAAKLQIGDQVQLTIVAAGCAPGGHEGHVYVTGVGSFFPPGLMLQASAPASVVTGSTLSYTMQYRNTASQRVTNVQMTAQTPPNTVLQSFTPPPGATSCTGLGRGQTGQIVCSLAMLPAGGSGQWQMTVQVNPGAAANTSTLIGPIYSISSGSTPWLQGPAVPVQVLDPALGYAVSLTKPGTGTGAVSSTPSGLDCPSACSSTSTQLNNGGQISLSAQADSGNYFAGWSGACQGQGGCLISMLGAPLNVAANFVPLPVASATNAALNLQVGQPLSALVPISASGGTAPLSFSVAPPLPAGLSFDAGTGSVSGTPSIAASAATYTVTVQDALSYSSNASFTLTVSPPPQSQTITFGSAPPLPVGGSAFISATATSGLTVSLSSQTPSICSVTGHTVTGLAAGSCNLMASQGGNSAYNPAPDTPLTLPVTRRNASTASGSGGTVNLSFSGGGNNATLLRMQSIPVTGAQGSPGTPPPASLQFPYGLTDLAITNLNPGAGATVTLSYPQALPANTQYWKYGKQSAADTPHWYAFTGAIVSGNTITLPLVDGASGDDDGIADGTITDPGGPAIGPDATMGIPSLSNAGALALSLLLGLSALGRLRCARAHGRR